MRGSFVFNVILETSQSYGAFMKTLSDIEYLKDVRALVRVDFNVPIIKGKVVNDYRIRMALPTINFLRAKGAKVVLISHLEVKEGEKATLEPVVGVLENLGVSTTFVKNIRNATDEIAKMSAGSCILLENLRQFDGEKTNDQQFAKELASLGDFFVNDAFSVCHREHASIVGVPKLLPSYAGLQLQNEIEHLSQAFHAMHPFLFILGGAKFETKLPLLERFIRLADTVFVGGALAHDFFKGKGYEVGKSLVSVGEFDLSKYFSNPVLMLPEDVVIENRETRPVDCLINTDKIMDAGPKTLELLKAKIDAASFILWNGPLGLYEGGYCEATQEVAKAIAARFDVAGAAGKITSIVGGGDTLAAIATLKLEDKFTFISTAGGAMLDFLTNGTLPGIDALNL